MADVRIRVSETGSAAVASGFRNVDQSLRGVGRTGTAVGGALARQFSALPGMVGRLSGALGGLGVALGGRAILKFDDALGQIQADAVLTSDEAGKLRAQVLGLSTAFGVNKDEILGAVQVFQDYGGMVREALPLLPQLSKTAKATGASMGDLATLASTLIQTLKQSPEEAAETIARLNAHAIAGMISLKQMAGVMPELSAAANNVGLSVDEISTALQAVGQTTGGNVDTAKHSLIALMAQLQANSAKLKKLGVDVFKIDPATGKESMRSLETIMSEVMQKTGGKLSGKTGLLQFFNLESKKALDAFVSSYDRNTGRMGGTFATVKAAGAGASTKDIDAQFKRRTEGIAAESEKIKRSMAGLDEAFQTYGKKVLGWAAANPLAAGGAALGGYAALKGGGSLIKWLMNRGKGGVGGLAGAAGATPVFVVNMPGGGLPGVGGSAPGAAGAAGAAGAGGTAAGAKGLLARVAGSALGTIGIAAGAGIAANAVGSLDAEQKLQAASAYRTKNYAQGGIGVSLVQQAASLAALSRRGVGSYEGANGRQALTSENVMATLAAQAQKQGASGATWEAVLPVLRQMLGELQKGPKVTVAAPGIDNPRVEAGRGK